MSNSINIRQKYAFRSNSPASTFNFGKQLGERLKTGSIIALIGELGCGKTLFTRGICVGLGVPERRVNSPTFAFVNEYLGRLPVFHIDLYRLNTIDEEFEIGLLDYLAKADSGVVVLEWAEKALVLLPNDYLQVQFEVLSARRRQLTLVGFGKKSSSLLRELGDQ
ncbi:MAG TPA: tRNA (adenosine(37)-N6)-threonylcarbamoyltransferase complex ATPase subunit type 1 TsaE [Dehalococcoidales bacterium]|nr:tRNA (adenosine(37)-N6)-threonylcarbamoyltransferase complex ATPase subunit type 1 TsaE [Dehalococcoidales bacterium]